jgi:hypothetical protein
MKEMPVTTAVVLTLTMLLLAPLEANAGGRGGRGGGTRVGGHHFVGHHFVFGRNALARQHFRSLLNQNNFNNSGLWGVPWYYDEPYPYDDYLLGYQTPQRVVRPEPPQTKCEHSEQTRTVPSANGGTTEVTILRC